MGYYTNYKLEIVKGNDGVTNYKAEISKAAGGYEDLFDGESHKWYDHEQDMKAYSLKHPNTLFKLEGIGEENGDLWHKYFLNGKVQVCQARIEYDEFNESKLI